MPTPRTVTETLNHCTELLQILCGCPRGATSDFNGILGDFVHFVPISQNLLYKTTDQKSFIFGYLVSS